MCDTADCFSVLPSEDVTPFWVACADGNLELCLVMNRSRGVDVLPLEAVNMMLSDERLFTTLQIAAYRGHLEVCAWLLDDECSFIWMARSSELCRCALCRDQHVIVREGGRCSRCSYVGLVSPLYLDAFDLAVLYASRQQRGSTSRSRGLSVMTMLADASNRPTVPSARAVKLSAFFSTGKARRIARLAAVRTYFADLESLSFVGAAELLLEYACVDQRSLGQVAEVVTNVVSCVLRDEVEQMAEMLTVACDAHGQVSQAVDVHVRPTLRAPHSKALRDMSDDSFRLAARLRWIEACPDNLLRLVMCGGVKEDDVLLYLLVPMNGLARPGVPSSVMCSVYEVIAGLGFSAALDRIQQLPDLWCRVDVDVVAENILRAVVCVPPHEMRFGRNDLEHELVARFARRSGDEVDAYAAHFIKIFRRCEPRHTRAWYAICCRHTSDSMKLYHPGMTEAALVCLVWFGNLSNPAAAHYKALYEACIDGSHNDQLARAARDNLETYRATRSVFATVGGAALANVGWPGCRACPARAVHIIVRFCVC